MAVGSELWGFAWKRRNYQADKPDDKKICSSTVIDKLCECFYPVDQVSWINILVAHPDKGRVTNEWEGLVGVELNCAFPPN